LIFRRHPLQLDGTDLAAISNLKSEISDKTQKREKRNTISNAMPRVMRGNKEELRLEIEGGNRKPDLKIQI
jgi:hypothetical protein